MPVIIRICCVAGIAKIVDILNPVHCCWRGLIPSCCGLVVGLCLRLGKACLERAFERGPLAGGVFVGLGAGFIVQEWLWIR